MCGDQIPSWWSRHFILNDPMTQLCLIWNKLHFSVLFVWEKVLVGVVNLDWVNLILASVVQYWNCQERIASWHRVQLTHVVTGTIVNHLWHNFRLLCFSDCFNFSQRLMFDPVWLSGIFDWGCSRSAQVTHSHFSHTVHSQLLAQISVLTRCC